MHCVCLSIGIKKHWSIHQVSCSLCVAIKCNGEYMDDDDDDVCVAKHVFKCCKEDRDMRGALNLHEAPLNTYISITTQTISWIHTPCGFNIL